MANPSNPVFVNCLNHLIHVEATQRTIRKMLEKLGISPDEFNTELAQEQKKLEHLANYRYSPAVGLEDRELVTLLLGLKRGR